MRVEDQHPSGEDLLALADGELGSRQSARVRAHLENCLDCRQRVLRTERASADFNRAYFETLEAGLPPSHPSRASLRARLAEARRASSPAWKRFASVPSRFSLVLASAALAALLLVAILRLHEGPGPGPGPGPEPTASPTRSAGVIVPNRTLTPGAVRAVNLSDLCSSSRSDKNRLVSASLRANVLAAYGMQSAPPDHFEIDYLITPELGGSDDIRNLWPEPYDATWNAYAKDALEDKLHSMVCSGEIPLETAQKDLAGDWIAAYKKYFHSNVPVTSVLAYETFHKSESRGLEF